MLLLFTHGADGRNAGGGGGSGGGGGGIELRALSPRSTLARLGGTPKMSSITLLNGGKGACSRTGRGGEGGVAGIGGGDGGDGGGLRGISSADSHCR